MPAVCLYFQIHQPFRLGIESASLEGGSVYNRCLFDNSLNSKILHSVARNCYQPTNELLLRLIKNYNTEFKITLSISGVALEQFEMFEPGLLDSFRELVATGCVELLCETYHHSLAYIFNRIEFIAQIDLHREKIKEIFGVSPQIFRNTELIYDDILGSLISGLGFKGILAEGVDEILGEHSPNFLYRTLGTDLPLLLRNYRLSDDIGFRFSDKNCPYAPITADKFASRLHLVEDPESIVNIFLDYETFGEHQKSAHGIFEFLNSFPKSVLAQKNWRFLTMSGVIANYRPKSEMSFKRLTSWADTARDLSAWTGNNMQQRAISDAYALSSLVLQAANPNLTAKWRRLLTSDHFYYMCTKSNADGEIHTYFSPFSNPYDAFIQYMSALSRLEFALRKEVQHLSTNEINESPEANATMF